MIDIYALLQQAASLGLGAFLAVTMLLWKRSDDVSHKAALKEMTDAYRLLLEKSLLASQATNTVLENIAQSSRLGERLGAIEGAIQISNRGQIDEASQTFQVMNRLKAMEDAISKVSKGTKG